MVAARRCHHSRVGHRGDVGERGVGESDGRGYRDHSGHVVHTVVDHTVLHERRSPMRGRHERWPPSPLVDAQVDDDRPRLHRANSVLGNEHRRARPRHENCADDHVGRCYLGLDGPAGRCAESPPKATARRTLPSASRSMSKTLVRAPMPVAMVAALDAGYARPEDHHVRGLDPRRASQQLTFAAAHPFEEVGAYLRGQPPRYLTHGAEQRTTAVRGLHGLVRQAGRATCDESRWSARDPGRDADR